MFAVLAMLSDIPTYIAAIISELTGADTSAFLEFFSVNFDKVLEFIEQVLKSIG